MKKALGILGSLAIAFAFTATVKAADLDGLNASMNVRFLQTDNGTKGENRWGLHCVEMSVSKEVENVGGAVTYRLADTSGQIKSVDSDADGTVDVAENQGKVQSYPVEAKVYYKFGAASKVAAGLQFVPFGIYKWNNLYVPFADIPGQFGLVWDADWGFLYTYDAKPLLIDAGWWDNAGEVNLPGRPAGAEGAEKNTISARVGYDLLPNLNVGASYLNGSVDVMPVALTVPATADDNIRTDRTLWAIDSTWGIVPNLTAEAEYLNYKMSEDEGNVDPTTGMTVGAAGNVGLLQLKYDVVKVPSPFNKVSFVLEYSFDRPDNAAAFGSKTTNLQEEIWVQVAKNLSIFWQNVQETQDDNNPATSDTNKFDYFAIKYNLF